VCVLGVELLLGKLRHSKGAVLLGAEGSKGGTTPAQGGYISTITSVSVQM
jgi:hypothetical protein